MNICEIHSPLNWLNVAKLSYSISCCSITLFLTTLRSGYLQCLNDSFYKTSEKWLNSPRGWQPQIWSILVEPHLPFLGSMWLCSTRAGQRRCSICSWCWECAVLLSALPSSLCIPMKKHDRWVLRFFSFLISVFESAYMVLLGSYFRLLFWKYSGLCNGKLICL